ncbi:MAG: Rrf2 family transcriptional regulator [Verrucomicrobia bacterium]|nr:Rrf2 family transcriptional regulator [Verrucomicrobiota bacterium]MDA1005466.1 Rrf2 family transcriptional regulator [Verrucomicrobiota bacterium]
MKINANTDFLYRSLIYVALHPDRLVTAREIAEAYGLSINHIAKVCQDLIRHGLLEGHRGRGGGVRLAKPADKIRLGDVIHLGESKPLIIDCNAGIGGPCKIAPACRLRGVFAKAQRAFLAELNAHTLADMVAQPGMANQLRSLLGSSPATV